MDRKPCAFSSFPPQIWAWKAKRRFAMADTLDGLGVIFPFEVDYFKDTELPVDFVGHPFLEEGHVPDLTYAPRKIGQSLEKEEIPIEKGEPLQLE